MKTKTCISLLALALAAALLAACGTGVPSAGARTPMPTIIPATPAPPAGAGKLAAVAAEKACRVRALDLIGAWVAAGNPETEAFPFTGVDGAACQATYPDDVLPLFHESNVWYSGALACTACHASDLTVSYAQMDLSSYAGILAGSRRQSADAKGNDILGAGDWEKSTLYRVLFTKWMPLGRPQTTNEKGPLVLAGTKP